MEFSSQNVSDSSLKQIEDELEAEDQLLLNTTFGAKKPNPKKLKKTRSDDHDIKQLTLGFKEKGKSDDNRLALELLKRGTKVEVE